MGKRYGDYDDFQVIPDDIEITVRGWDEKTVVDPRTGYGKRVPEYSEAEYQLVSGHVEELQERFGDLGQCEYLRIVSKAVKEDIVLSVFDDMEEFDG